jgi:hypothetical protein
MPAADRPMRARTRSQKAQESLERPLRRLGSLAPVVAPITSA